MEASAWDWVSREHAKWDGSRGSDEGRGANVCGGACGSGGGRAGTAVSIFGTIGLSDPI